MYLTGSMGPSPFEGTSDIGIPCFTHEFFWQGLSHYTPAPILNPTFVSKANFCGLHRLSEYRKVFYHQHSS